ncbi:class I SAM-dependent methyltransferase [Sporosarcina sp. FSL K6-5500]|uniref:class I SAM-dependent methyltransferase n=1 Tax=Sporosarcina sp. FSL K6-5500 TaxID=2921558 RepID=UPI0030F53690
MEKLSMLNRIKEIYDKNENMIAYLKKIYNNKENSLEDILISYDFQAGAYTKGYKNNPANKDLYCSYLAEIINDIGEYTSILEVGVGEATTFAVMLSKLNRLPEKSYGFDISWSRIKYARKFIDELGIKDTELFTGDLFNMPLKDNSIDIVYTSHSVEPNGGREEEALQELYRVANKYLILLEPAYELANDEARTRMKEHGYVTNLFQTAQNLGYDIIEHKLFGISTNPLNPTGVMIIKKAGTHDVINPICCPVTKTDFIIKNNTYYSPESLLAYPVIEEVPCLLAQNAVVATKFMD